MEPIVALVGRPNVGKSTLFNRIVGKMVAIVDPTPGVTRDRIYMPTEWSGKAFVLIDTGGLRFAEDGIGEMVRKQALTAIEEAEVVVLVVDGKEGLHPLDVEIALLLRGKGKRGIVAVNKVDNPGPSPLLAEFYSLGLGDPIPVSAIHGLGIDMLLDRIVEGLPRTEAVAEEDLVKIAVVGRPNVGKSSFVNRVLGEERVIVDDLPGTTRDSIDTRFSWKGREALLIDTAGIRKKSKVPFGIEAYGVVRALRSIGRSDVSILLVDALEGVTEQDARIAGFIMDSGKGIVIVVNKWDLVERKEKGFEVEAFVRKALAFLPNPPVVLASAKTGKNVSLAIEAAFRVADQRAMRIPTGQLMRTIGRIISEHPPSFRGKDVRIYYMSQVGVKPPTFVLFTNIPDGVTENYKRFLANRIRELFGFEGSPIRILVRRKE
jgi:GTP-binding protein